MTDAIEQLQNDCANPQVSAVSLLQKSLPLAKRYDDRDFLDWATRELKGYTEPVADVEYRILKGEYALLTLDGRTLPVVWRAKNSNTKTRFITLPLAEMESLHAGKGSAFFVKINVDPTTLSFEPQPEPGEAIGFTISQATLSGFLHAVRQRVLDWTMTLPESSVTVETPGPVAPSPATVFYSWQSDLPNPTNRGFIQGSLERAIKDLKAEGELRVDPCIDRDTINVPGSPDIAATIFEKIESCGLFVCDVSIINKGTAARPTPNPNVLIELGFAVKALGWNRIICVFNEATGSVEELPFDLRQRRIRCYRLEEQQEKADVRKLLAGVLKSDLQTAFAFTAPDPRSSGESRASETQVPPRVEILGATLECQPPIIAPSQPHIHNIRPEYGAGRLVWTVAASLFIDSRPGAPLTLVLHRCEAWLNDSYSGDRLPLQNVAFQTAPQSQVSVDDAVVLVRGPGKLLFQGSCETPSRQAGFPDVVRIDLRLPISELCGEAMEVTLELHEVQHAEGWPLRWKHREGDDVKTAD